MIADPEAAPRTERWGIYTLANDVVLDQLVALLNSIERHLGAAPVCVFPYDERLDGVRAVIAERPAVTLFEKEEVVRRWDERSRRIWSAHPTAPEWWRRRAVPEQRWLGLSRRLCAFDPEAPFSSFVYTDADTLVLGDLAAVSGAQRDHPFVAYDFQFKHPRHVFEPTSQRLADLAPGAGLERELFCSGFFAAQRDLFPESRLAELEGRLAAGEAELLRPQSPDQSLLNYLRLRGGVPLWNLALELPPRHRTGNAVTSRHFEQRGDRLYDRGRPLSYLHYIGLPAHYFSQLCQGENLAFPYREMFLHYRYLHEPGARPALPGRPREPGAAPAGRARRALSALHRTLRREPR